VKVALVLQRYNPFGGYERQAALLARSLVRRGVFVTVFTGEWASGPEEGIEVVRVPVVRLASWLKVLSFAFFSKRMLSRHKGFDVVLGYDRTISMDIYRAGNACHREWQAFRRRHGGLREHISLAINPLHAVINGIEKRLFGNIQRGKGKIVVLSEVGKDQILKHYSVDAGRFFVIPPALDLTRIEFHIDDEAKKKAREPLGISPDIPLLLHVGSGFSIKGLESTIRAAAILKEKGSRAILLVAGKDKGGTKRLEKLAASLGVKDRVIFLGGVKDVGALYSAADLFVLPSLFETFGTAAIEALAAGLPVILGKGAGAARFIEDEKAGWTVDVPADQVRLASMIEEALLEEEGHKRAGRLASERTRRRNAALKCGPDVVMARFISLVETAAAEKKAASGRTRGVAG